MGAPGMVKQGGDNVSSPKGGRESKPLLKQNFLASCAAIGRAAGSGYHCGALHVHVVRAVLLVPGKFCTVYIETDFLCQSLAGCNCLPGAC